MRIARSATVLIDSREVYPWEFPETVLWQPDHPQGNPVLLAITPEKVALRTGDYALEGFEGCCLVERKASLRELEGNFLTQDRGRMLACLDRLRSACRAPLLVIEATPAQLLAGPEADIILARAFADCQGRGVRVWLVPGSTSSDNRRRVGRLVLLQLLAGTLDASP